MAGTKDFYADLDLHSNKISDLADGVNPADAVNRRQLDSVSAAVPHVTVASTPPVNPQPFDLWVDLSA